MSAGQESFGAVVAGCDLITWLVLATWLLVVLLALPASPAGKWVLVDVRRPDQYEEGHAQGSVSVPMYSRIDMSKADFAKVGVFGGYKLQQQQQQQQGDFSVPMYSRIDMSKADFAKVR
jgi:hypothetical protein